MKMFLIAVWLLLLSAPLLACPVCGRRQPKGFANITHGTGPEGPLDYWILYGAIALVLLTLVLFVWYLLKPGTRTAPVLNEYGLTDWHHD